MITIVAVLVAAACIAACARRLAFAISPTPIDPVALLAALRGDAGRARFESIARRVHADPDATWERALLDALRLPPDERAAFVNEQLTEMDYMTRRWQRVPRVCASVASSSGFLLASLALRNALADPGAFAEETRHAALGNALTAAVNVAAIGMAGAAFCIAAQMRATRAARTRLDATDKLVERLESLTAETGEIAMSPAAHG
jgi:hypothetical protein